VSDPGGLLDGAAVFVAVMTVAFGWWYPEIERASKIAPHAAPANRGPQRDAVRAAMLRCYWLLGLSTLMTLMLVPDAVAVILDAVRQWNDDGWGSLRRYDAVRAIVVVLGLLGVLSTVLLVHTAINLCRAQRRLE
jgi:hypothetical protein